MARKLREPCGYMILGWDMKEPEPCGRPKGHKPEWGQIAGGHAFRPLTESVVNGKRLHKADPPTKSWRRRTVWEIVE